MQKKLLILALVVLILVGGTFILWGKKADTGAEQNDMNQVISENLLMSLNSDGSKNYRSEGYGFEMTIPKEWTSFRDAKIEKSEEGTPFIKFLFETKDSRYFNEYNCQGKCVQMFFVEILTHDKFNNEFQERFVAPGNLSGKGPAILVTDRYVFSGANMGYFSSDPPSDLMNLKSELPILFKSFKSLQ